MSGHPNKYIMGQVPSAERDRDDFYPTPARATESLLSVEQFEGDIWEPACGDGAISRILEKYGHKVFSTDLIDRGFGIPNRDFLLEYQTFVDNIITNPPFKLAEEFAQHALRCARRKVVLLCRVAWLEGKARREMFENTPLARVWVFSSRLRMQRGGKSTETSGGMIAFAWYVWEHGHIGRPVLGWI